MVDIFLLFYIIKTDKRFVDSLVHTCVYRSILHILQVNNNFHLFNRTLPHNHTFNCSFIYSIVYIYVVIYSLRLLAYIWQHICIQWNIWMGELDVWLWSKALLNKWELLLTWRICSIVYTIDRTNCLCIQVCTGESTNLLSVFIM